MRITVAQVDDLRRKLEELPPQESAKREVSKQEAVALMADQVAKLQQRGYAMDEIANFLTANGLPVSVQTLKSYLSRARRTGRTKQRRKVMPEKAAPASTPSPELKSTSRNGRRQLSGEAQVGGAKNESSTGVRSSGFVPREDSTII
jgi:hypothetical protein